MVSEISFLVKKIQDKSKKISINVWLLKSEVKLKEII